MKKLTLFVGLLLSSMAGFAQGSSEYGSGLKFNLNEDGSKYMRMIAWNQVWFRPTQMNPGTMINSEPASSSSDMGLRRLRYMRRYLNAT